MDPQAIVNNIIQNNKTENEEEETFLTKIMNFKSTSYYQFLLHILRFSLVIFLIICAIVMTVIGAYLSSKSMKEFQLMGISLIRVGKDPTSAHNAGKMCLTFAGGLLSAAGISVGSDDSSDSNGERNFGLRSFIRIFITLWGSLQFCYSLFGLFLQYFNS